MIAFLPINRIVPMASNFILNTVAILALLLVLSVPGSLGGGITCEELDRNKCAFAVSSYGKRCVLEKQVRRSGEEAYTCCTTEIEANKFKGWIETEQCIEACGVDRKSLGISSDSLPDSHFMKKLCSPQCYETCLNIVDLYFNLAAGEGACLSKLCETQGANGRREMVEIRSSGNVTPRLELKELPTKFIVTQAMAPY